MAQQYIQNFREKLQERLDEDNITKDSDDYVDVLHEEIDDWVNKTWNSEVDEIVGEVGIDTLLEMYEGCFGLASLATVHKCNRGRALLYLYVRSKVDDDVEGTG